MTPADARCSLHPNFAAAGTCRRCGRFACTQCFQSANGLCTECAAREHVEVAPTPWERRAELGFVQGYLQTVKAAALEPGRFWGTFDAQGPLGDAFLFGWLTTALAALPTGLLASLNLAQTAAIMKAMPNMPPPVMRMFDFMEEHPLQFGLGFAAYMIIIYPLGLAMGAGITHVLLLIWGAGSSGFGATMRVQCYSHFPSLAGWIPLVGAVAGIWQLIMSGWGYTKAHRTTVGRVVGAMLSPLILVVFCGCGLAILIPLLLRR